jgi:hypothetical protein
VCTSKYIIMYLGRKNKRGNSTVIRCVGSVGSRGSATLVSTYSWRCRALWPQRIPGTLGLPYSWGSEGHAEGIFINDIPAPAPTTHPPLSAAVLEPSARLSWSPQRGCPGALSAAVLEPSARLSWSPQRGCPGALSAAIYPLWIEC